MDLNELVFPSPQPNVNILFQYENELIFIPKVQVKENSNYFSSSSNPKFSNNEFIPCLLLLSRIKYISKYFLIIFHGNAEDIFASRDLAEKIKFELSINVIIVEYPGYSLYKESKSSEKVLHDSLTVYDYLIDYLKIDEENIFVFGRSIGSGPSLYLSSKRNPGSLILMSPFTSVRAVVGNLVGNFLKYFISER
jgi:hypothetical protein